MSAERWSLVAWGGSFAWEVCHRPTFAWQEQLSMNWLHFLGWHGLMRVTQIQDAFPFIHHLSDHRPFDLWMLTFNLWCWPLRGTSYFALRHLHWLPARHLLWEMKRQECYSWESIGHLDNSLGSIPEWALSRSGKPISLIIYWKNILFSF